MKNTTLLLLCLFVLATFQYSFANTNETDAPLEQAFSTPEQTWGQFKTAILEGDFDSAHECCRQDKSKGVLKFKKMGTEKRKNIVESMQEIEKIHLQENTAKYKLIRNSNGSALSTFVYFEKIDNEWKIENY